MGGIRPSALTQGSPPAGERPEGLWPEHALPAPVGLTAATSAPSHAQALLTWPEEKQVLRQWGLRDALAILDLGCGAGDISAQLLSEAPAATLVGMDLDGDALRQAAGSKADDARRRCLVHADAHGLPFKDASFDFVHARVVFEYLRRPSRAASEALRILRPGGRVVVRHLAHSYSVRPPLEGLDRLVRLYETLPSQQGWDRGVESQLGSILQAAGATRVEEKSLTSESQPDNIETYLDVLMGPRKRTSLLEASTAHSGEIETFPQAKTRWLENPKRTVLLHFRMTCGLK